MTLDQFLAILKECPLIASVQASPGSPLDDPETLLKLAQASLSQGVKVLRLEGVENIKRIKGETGVPVIGLIKRQYPGYEHYITPTMREVEELLETGCEVIAIDSRMHWDGKKYVEQRSPGNGLSDLVERVHSEGRIVLGDCPGSSLVMGHAASMGIDIAATTFGDAWFGTETFEHHHFKDLGYFLRLNRVPVIAEGRFSTEAQIRWAMHMGVAGVVVGGALNDPIKITQRFVKAATLPRANVGAVDIGGTWLRFGLFSPEWQLLTKRKAKLPPKHTDRLAWIQKRAMEFGVSLIGVSTGGDVHPATGTVESTKETIPDNEFARFSIEGLQLRALNDGLATAWGHLVYGSRRDWWIRPGERTVTLALGTGLGCGITSEFGILEPTSYPRLNDLEFENGMTFEQALGGQYLGRDPSIRQQELALRAVERALDIFSRLLQPSAIYICGGVGLSPWMKKGVKALLKRRWFAAEWTGEEGSFSAVNRADVQFSPFGPDAGLYGAAALALFPPVGVFKE